MSKPPTLEPPVVRRKPRLGAHTSISGGIQNAISEGQEIGAEVVQIFSKNQQQWQGRDYLPEELASFAERRKNTGIEPVMIHTSYLINLASARPEVLRKSVAALADELRRAALLKIPFIVLHPGSHGGAGESAGIALIAANLDQALEEAAADDITILLETTAGQGSSLGWRFQHLRDIIGQSSCGERLSVCLDTCHVFGAGYDLRTAEQLSMLLDEFDRIVGLKRLKALHLNDSLKELGSRRDRHARIGEGMIGSAGFRALVNEPRLAGLPMLLEVPGGLDAYRQDLARLRSFLPAE